MGNNLVEGLSAMPTSSKEILPDILLMNFTIVNACIIGNLNDKTGKWVLVDTGLKQCIFINWKCLI